MAKRMLIDATHMEETRVVVLNGNRLEEFDFETSTKKQLKGNIYLAKVTRVEPSLQAAFVDYGGDRHGFLAFNEIHPDYYQIPVADRMALLREEEALAAKDLEDGAGVDEDNPEDGPGSATDGMEDELPATNDAAAGGAMAETEDGPAEILQSDDPQIVDDSEDPTAETNPEFSDKGSQSLEEVGGEDEAEVHAAGRRRTQPKRHRYKIQEVIKRRQIILVQVVKEERGTKGAALTTYLSLAGRYCVLMPNTTKGGGISRKITSPKDRNRLRGFISDLNIPDGVAVILRTAAIERSKAEIRRDFEYLIRTWQLVRDTTLESIAPTLVYEEGNLIKRSIRDLYSKDIDNVLVEGEQGYKTAKDFMRMLMPSHAKRVQPYKDAVIPLFHRYQVDSQIDAMHSPRVQLKSGGYIVINTTEALVAIDVNSGRATRERNIEETAYKTNLEAAEEIARQLKLRDLAGLIVIDFIDMMENRNQHTVERRLKEAMRSDRARIQIGRISPFGLLELSRQRLRPSLIEASTTPCPHCEGTGLIRSTESAALHVLRAVEEEGIRGRSSEIRVTVATGVALYILNEKRDMLTEIEGRHGFRVLVLGDDSLVPPKYDLDLVADKSSTARSVAETGQQAVAAEEDSTPEKAEGEQSGGRRSRRRRSRRGEKASNEPVEAAEAEAAGADGAAYDDTEDGTEDKDREAHPDAGGEEAPDKQRRRRRGRRGGRRHARRKQSATAVSVDDPDTSEAPQIGPDAENAPEQAPAGEASEAAGGKDDSPKPRRRRSRARKPKTPTAEPAVEQAAAPGAGGNGNGANSRDDTGIHTTGPGIGAPTAAPEAAELPDSADPAEKTDTNKRRGWWNRLTQ